MTQESRGHLAGDIASALLGVDGLRVVKAETEADGTLTVWAVTGHPGAAVCPGCSRWGGQDHLRGADRGAVLTGVSNARSEALNRIAKLEARQAYAFRNPANQRRRVRTACTRDNRRAQDAVLRRS